MKFMRAFEKSTRRKLAILKVNSRPKMFTVRLFADLEAHAVGEALREGNERRTSVVGSPPIAFDDA